LCRFFDMATLPLKVIPYPLAAACEVSFGSLTGDLLTLGIHPHSTPERSLGVIAHEAVHAWAESRRQQGEETSAGLEGPVATVVGNAWTVGELCGRMPDYPWYDDPSVDRVAHQLYDTVSRAIARGRPFSEIASELAEISGSGTKAAG